MFEVLKDVVDEVGPVITILVVTIKVILSRMAKGNAN